MVPKVLTMCAIAAIVLLGYIAYARLVARLRDSLAEMTELNRLKEDFVATVSHELRTPLTSILGFAKTLLRSDATYTPEETRAMLEAMDRQSERLRALIENLLLVSRVEAEPTRAAIGRVSPGTLARDVVSDFERRAEQHRFVLEMDGRLPEVRTDETAVRRILCNLVENAIKYSPIETRIIVGVRQHDGGLVLSVTDEGPGIAEDARERIFERFYQLDQSNTRRVGGAGLGLYICRSLAETIRGRVWVETGARGVGSTFSLWLPGGLRAAEGAEERAPRRSVRLPQRSAI